MPIPERMIPTPQNRAKTDDQQTERRVKPMKDEMILSPEMDEELSNGKGEDENE